MVGHCGRGHGGCGHPMPPHMHPHGPPHHPPHHPHGMPPPPHHPHGMPPHGDCPKMPHHMGPHMGPDCGPKGMMKHGKPVLTYFDVIGFAEQSRLCFIIGDIPFVDRRVTREDWVKHYKAYSPSGRAPYLEVHGKVLVESQAIMQYAARRAGLVPCSPESNLKVQMAIELIESDMKQMIAMAPEFTEMECRMKWWREKMTESHPAWCDKYETMFKTWMNMEGGDEWLVDNRMSYLDVFIAASILRAQSMSHVDVIPNETKYPVLTKVYQGVMNHHRVSAYMAAQKKKSEKPVLHHFGYNTFVQPMMWAMKIGNIDFESKVVTREEWAAGYKSQSPSGQLPMLEVEGEKYVESVAILQYVASRAGLMPEPPFEAAHALAVVKVCGELRDLAGRIYHCTDAGAKEALIEKSVNATIPEMVARIEEVIGQHQDQVGHIIGKKLSYADLWVAQTFSGLLQAAQKGIKLMDVESMAPHMKKTHNMVFAIPAVKELEAEEMTKVKPVLTYFDIAGRAEALRYAMHLGGIEFEDRRITREDWMNTYKAMSPTGQCPFLTVGQGQTIVESKAIMEWVQEVAPKLKPTGHMGGVIAEQLVSSWSRVHMALKAVYAVPETERPSMEAKLREETVGPAIAIQERLWSDSKTHEGCSVGGKMTWVDAWVAGEIEYLKAMHMMGDDWQETYPTLAAIYRRVTTHSTVATYRAARGN